MHGRRAGRGVRGVIPARLESLARWELLYPAPGGAPRRYQPTGNAWAECEGGMWTLDVELLRPDDEAGQE